MDYRIANQKRMEDVRKELINSMLVTFGKKNVRRYDCVAFIGQLSLDNMMDAILRLRNL